MAGEPEIVTETEQKAERNDLVFPSWSNGPIWAEYLANALGADLLDYAHGGSTTDNTFIQGWIPLPNGTHLTVPSLHDQISTHLTTPNTTPTSPQTLYTIWSGANDFFQAAPHTAFSLITHEFWTHVASNIRDAAGRLRQSGARTIIVFTLAPIHHSPAGLNLTAIERLAVETLIKATNHDIKKDVSPIAHVYDPYAFFEEVKKDPRQYGFSDTTSPCLENWWAYNKIEVMNLSAPPIVCESPGTYVFWDEVHPTTAGHRVLGQHVKEFIDRGYTSGAMRGVVAALHVSFIVVYKAFKKYNLNATQSLFSAMLDGIRTTFGLDHLA
ncbi:hypothetical protein HK104_002999 [Borealophlyctis nickersoniae]|nr:hypothetical protein HK104_002999 [Borealophlyctis nickersoniae]